MTAHRVWFVAVALLAFLGPVGAATQHSTNRPDQGPSAATDTQHNEDEKAARENHRPLAAPLDITVRAEPWAFRANGKWHLVYELHLTNIGNEDCTVTQIEVLGSGDRPKTLASLTGKDLDADMVHPWVDVGAPATLRPAGMAVVFMWVTLNQHEDIPSALSHRITMRVGGYPDVISIVAPSLAVNRDPVAVIGHPLRGADWGAAHGPDNTSSHRRGLLAIEGHSYIAERYAIDWLRITPTGDVHSGSGNENQDYPGYGAAVYAVADGVITEVVDGIPENVPGKAPSVPITLRTICGNHIIQKVGPHLYASYCHLQPGLHVAVGTRIRQGQVLGSVGNSGSSDAPHLHFQICDANATLACEGVPYAFSSFLEEHKTFTSSNEGGPQKDTVHSREIPSNETLVDFR